MGLDKTMLAAVFRGDRRTVVEELPVPSIGPGEALVRISVCGVCGTDLKKIEYGLVDPPRVFGHEMAGTIDALGAGVEGWSVGERVAVMHHVPCLDCYYCSNETFAQCPTYKRTGTVAAFEPAGGGFSQYIRVMDWIVRKGMVRLPADISDEEATFIEPLNTVLKGVQRADIREGQTALVIGQGQIGLLFNQVLGLRGLHVIGSDPQEWRRGQGMRFGASATIDPATDDLVAVVKERTMGRGADLAVVAVATTNVVQQAFDAIRPGGTVLLFAQTRLNDPLEVDAGAICMLEKELIGSYSADITLQASAAEMIFSRQVNVRELITHRFPLSQIDRAFDVASRPAAGSLKVVVHP